MKPAPFRYHAAQSIDEATDMLATLDNPRLLAGGQSLMPMMNMRYVLPDHVIDLNPISDLAGIDTGNGRIRIGALTRQRDMLQSDALAGVAPVIREALGFVGHFQTRNRGTLGGSLAHMDPAAELVGIAALMDARIGLASRTGLRETAIADFPKGYMTPDIRPDELLTHVELTPWPAGHGYDFREFAQRHGDFAVVGVGTLLTLDTAGLIERAAIVLIGVGNGPMRLDEAEDLLVGEKPSGDLFREAGANAANRPMLDDALVSEAYRRHLAAVLVRRSLERASERAGGGET